MSDDWPGTGSAYPTAHAPSVWLPGDIDEGDYTRRRGYLDAARMLINACDTGIGRHLLLPALGCYRHYFELQLKELARIGNAIRAAGGPDDVHGETADDRRAGRRGHVLDIADVTATLTHMYGTDGTDEQRAKALARRDLTGLKAALAELNALDPRGVTARYSYHDHGDGSRTPTVKEGFWLDLPRTVQLLETGAAIAEATDAYLDAWRAQYAEYLADMAELEAQHAAEYADLMMNEFDNSAAPDFDDQWN